MPVLSISRIVPLSAAPFAACRAAAFILANAMASTRNVKPVVISPYGEPRAERCAYCGQVQVLAWVVKYYEQWHVMCCHLCAAALDRHVRWHAEARTRHLQNRYETRKERRLPQP